MRARVTLGLVAVVMLLSACATGARPALGEPVGTGVTSVDQLLKRLEDPVVAPFTATYAITRKLGSVSTTATVAHEGDVTATTIGDVRFITGPDEVTCVLSTGTCEPGLQEQRISELAGVTSQFWSTSTAQALRVATNRRNGEPEAAPATIAGVAADCVRLSVGAGIEQYCVTTAGPLASVDRADYAINLTAWSPAADPTALARPG